LSVSITYAVDKPVIQPAETWPAERLLCTEAAAVEYTPTHYDSVIQKHATFVTP